MIATAVSVLWAGDAGCCERRGGRSPCRLIPVRYLCGLRLSLPLSATVPKELCHNEPAHPSPSWAPSGGTFLSELPPVDTHTRLPRQLLRQLQSRKESNKSVQRLSFSKGGGGRSCSLVGRQHLNLREYPRTQTCESLFFVLALHPDLALPSWGTQPQRQCPVSTTTSSLHSLLVYSHPCPELPDPSGAVATSTAHHLQEAIEQPQSPLSQQQIQSSAKFCKQDAILRNPFAQTRVKKEIALFSRNPLIPPSSSDTNKMKSQAEKSHLQ